MCERERERAREREREHEREREREHERERESERELSVVALVCRFHILGNLQLKETYMLPREEWGHTVKIKASISLNESP